MDWEARAELLGRILVVKRDFWISEQGGIIISAAIISSRVESQILGVLECVKPLR